MPSDQSDPAGLPPRLSALQIVGLSHPDHPDWNHLRALQRDRLQGRVLFRALIQLLPIMLAITLVAGHINAWFLAAWSLAALTAVVIGARADRELLRRRPRVMRRRDLWRHAFGTSCCALVWAVPLLLLPQANQSVDHMALWALASMLIAGLAFTASAAPLGTLLFTLVAGGAAVGGFAIQSEWTLAAVGFILLVVALFGAIEVARNDLTARSAAAGLADRNKLVSLLMREFEDQDAYWLWQIDTARRVRHPAPRFAHALGLDREAMGGRSFLELLAGRSWAGGALAPSLHDLAEQLKRRQSFSDLLVQVDVAGATRWWKLSGAPTTDHAGQFSGYRGVGCDVTAQHASEQRIAFLARYDALTRLPNRTMVTEAIEEALRCAMRDRRQCTFMMIDLDRFKSVNDTLGHPMGDKLLAQVAARLRAAFANRGLCGRLGGDEFAAILPHAIAGEVDSLAELVIAELSRPFEIEGHRLSIGASIGSAQGPLDGGTVEALMRNADLALYRAKSEGRGAHRRFEPALQAQVERRRELEQCLGHALEREELQLLFHPIVEAEAEQLIGFEALLRWNSRQHGLIKPERCIPLAEECGLILPIGEWVLHEACQQAVRWPASALVTVNVSGAQLLDVAFPARVERALADSGLPAERLEIELTEAALRCDGNAVLEAVAQLRRLGCGVALDDFGTGSASLAHLRQLRFTTLKLDRPFVHGAARGHAESLATVRAALATGESLGMKVTAEGVESSDQAMLMRQLGCDRLQGFHYARPLNAAEALALALRRMADAEPPAEAPIVLAGRVVAA